MVNKKLLLIIFIIVAIVQLYVPAKMIFDKEAILELGKEYKFKTEPIDPNDPFRGKYITLRFEENKIEVFKDTNWIYNEVVYVKLTKDKDGFAKIKSASKTEPSSQNDYLKCKVDYYANFNEKVLYIIYPFERYYMEESKAQDAENVYRKSSRDTTQVAYALINIKNGEAVIKDVLINGIPIKTIVKAQQEKANISQ